MCLGIRGAICPDHAAMGVTGVDLIADEIEDDYEDDNTGRLDDDFGGWERRHAS
jgi:hypothetical protein